MRYAAPVAMPAGLGEWLGAELEARGVEAASLYARAVLSILLHSEVAEVEAELDHPERDPNAWNPRAALELELRLERHNKETRRGRPSIKKNYAPKSAGQPKRSSNMATPNGKSHNVGLLRRRPHSWNGGDEEALKKCAAIECLLSATDDGQWGPVEKLVDELCSRLKILQLEQQRDGDRRSAKYRRTATAGGSVPERVNREGQGATIYSPSDSDSFTSVSSPDVDPEDYGQAFPPLEYLSDSDQGPREVSEPTWNVRKNAETNPMEGKSSRVRFVRMTGTRLSPPPQHGLLTVVQSYGDSCPSESYFGDCSRDSSPDRPSDSQPDLITTAKGRLYERGAADLTGGSVGELASVNDVLESAFKSFSQFQEEEPRQVEEMVLPYQADDWARKDGGDESLTNIWAPLESDWALLGPESLLMPWPTESIAAKVPTDAAVQLSLALLNHHPERSGFSPVLAKSLMLHTTKESLPRSSKLMEWLANLAATGAAQQSDLAVDGNEEEIESILKKEQEPTEPVTGPIVDEHKLLEDQEEENLLTSPKTHFCPIQQEGDAEVQVSDGATFDVNAQPDQVHFLRSPSGALYLPDCEDNGDGWKGWAKYMVYKSPPSPSPLLALEAAPADPLALDHQLLQESTRPTTPFTLKFRVVQTEKYCQTDSRLSIDQGALAISSPFSGSFSNSTAAEDIWKFDARAVTLDDVEEPEVKEAVIQELDAKEEELDGLLSEVWSTAATALIANGDGLEEELADPPLMEETALIEDLRGLAAVVEVPVTALGEKTTTVEAEEFDLDELWNPFMDETGEEQVDVCEWVPQPYRGADGDAGEEWAEEDGLAVADSWPPPNIPIEYLDDEFFEEIYGSLDSMKTSETASTTGGSKNSRRRRRRSSKNQAPARRPKRPCSFFVEGECRRPDCKFSHDLGSITCRFWIESSCFKGDECPFLHGVPAKESHRSCSDAELSESCGSVEDGFTPRGGSRSSFRERGGKTMKKFQFDLEADFPSLSQAPNKGGASSGGPIVSQSRPIAITQGFATADQLTGSSLENLGPENGAVAVKRRRKRFSQRPTGLTMVGTSSETSPVETVSINVAASAGKRSRKVAKIHSLCVPSIVLSTKRDKKRSTAEANVLVVQSKERRRTKSEHDSHVAGAGGPTRSRLSSSYKEG